MKRSFKNNFWLIFGGIFALVGTIMGLVAGVVWWNTETTVRQGIRTYGTVTDLVRNSGKNGSTYSPVIEFQTATGQRHTYYSNTSSSPPAYDIGESVKMWYDPNDPTEVVLAGLDRWLLPAIFGGFFVIFGAIGYGCIFYQFLMNRRRAWLLANGRPIQAALLDVGVKHHIKMGNQSPFTIRAQWHDPASDKVYTYESEYIWYDPSLYVQNRAIPVLIDPNNPKSYHVDLSFLPEAGN